MANITLSGVHGAEYQPFDTLADVPEGADALLPLALVKAEGGAVKARVGKLAILVPSDAPYNDLEAVLNITDTFTIDFPAFNDGRGFSLAVRLRKDFGYTGEIRAHGHVIPDQAQFLLRAGFDTAEVPEERVAAFEVALKRFSAFYQYTYNGDQSVAHARHSAPSDAVKSA